MILYSEANNSSLEACAVASQRNANKARERKEQIDSRKWKKNTTKEFSTSNRCIKCFKLGLRIEKILNLKLKM